MTDWDCEAYGPEQKAAGALCFFAGRGQRLCCTQDECRTRMTAERERLFDRIHDLAASGDPTWTYLAEEVTRPEQLLGGEPPNGEDET